MATNVPVLGFKQCMQAVIAAVKARVACLIIGAPGVGKSAMMQLVADEISRMEGEEFPLHTFLASTCDATDIGGFPIVQGAQLERIPMQEIRACSVAPGLLFMDEMTTVPPSVQGPCLRLFHERKAGNMSLHAKSAIVAACNPPEQAPGANELSAAMTNRNMIVRLRPEFDEVCEYFMNLDGPTTEVKVTLAQAEKQAQDAATQAAKGGKVKTEAAVVRSPLNEAARDWAATVRMEPRLLQLDPPDASIHSMAPWASPRAVEKALRVSVEAEAMGASMDVQYAVIAGLMGEESAAAYMGIKKYRAELPSVDEVRANPDKAKMPEKREQQIAAIGVIMRAADVNSFAAWIYAARLTNQEVQIAVARQLMTTPDRGPAAMAMTGIQAKTKMLASARQQIKRQ
jgi:MoxR-like ATPase